MNYFIAKYLLPDETIIHRTHRHWIVCTPPLFWFALAIFFWLLPGVTNFSGWMVCIIGVLNLFWCLINYFCSELAVTDMRVIVKTGLIGRNSLETMLPNIASIEVNQSPIGRILGYGTVVICDTGMVRSPFSFIDHPFEFRHAVQVEINRRYPIPGK